MNRSQEQTRQDLRHTAFNRVHDASARRQNSLQRDMQSTLFELMARNLNDNDYCQEICDIAVQQIGSPLVVLVEKSENDIWSPKAIGQSSSLADFESLFSFIINNCKRAENSPVPLILNCSTKSDSTIGYQAVLMPIRCENGFNAVFGLCFESSEKVPLSIPTILALSDSYRLHQRVLFKQREGWKLQALATMVELISEIELPDNIQEASHKCTGLLSAYFNAETVSLVFCNKSKVNCLSISGSSSSSKSVEMKHALSQAAKEALLGCESKILVDGASDGRQASIAHRALAKLLDVSFVGTFLIDSISAERIAVLIVAGNSDRPNAERVQRFMRAFAPRLGTTLQSKLRSSKGAWKSKVIPNRTFKNPRTAFLARVLTYALVPGLLIGTLFLPIQYRIRSKCQVEPSERRFVTAPFSGILASSHVKPGDFVRAGQILANLDGRELQLKRTSAQAELQRTLHEREAQLQKNEIASAVQLEFEYERLASEIAMYERQIDNLCICSPIDGLILSGDSEKLTQRGIGIGHVLFEIAPKDAIRVMVDIAAEDRAYASEGMRCSVWLQGQEAAGAQGILEEFRPVSELRSGKNAFVAKIRLDDESIKLRPGMVGHARVDSIPCTLGWALFHKPWWFIRSNLMFW